MGVETDLVIVDILFVRSFVRSFNCFFVCLCVCLFVTRESTMYNLHVAHCLHGLSNIVFPPVVFSFIRR